MAEIDVGSLSQDNLGTTRH